METIALVNLTPTGNLVLDNAWANTGGVGGNGWCIIPAGSAWSFSLVWTPGLAANPQPAAGEFIVEGTNDAVAQPVDTNVNAVADANLNIFIMRDDFGNTMTCPAQSNESTSTVNYNKIFQKQRPSSVRAVRVNYRNGVSGCNAFLTELLFHAVGLRDA